MAPKQKVCDWELNFLQAQRVPTHSSSTWLKVHPFSTHSMFLIIAAAAGGHNNPAVSSPWLSAAARPPANSTGPRRMSRSSGTPQGGVSISNPSDLEAGGEGTLRFRQQARVTAETSGPAFLKPHWVCGKEGPTSAHRLRATKEGREGERGEKERGERRRERGRELGSVPCAHMDSCKCTGPPHFLP